MEQAFALRMSCIHECAVTVGVGSTGCRMASRLGIGPHLLSGGFPGSSENKEESYAAQDVSSLGWLLANMLTSQDLAGVSFCSLSSTERCMVLGVTHFASTCHFALAQLLWLGLSC